MIVCFILTALFSYIIITNKELSVFSLPLTLLGRIMVAIPVLYLFYEFRKKEFMYYRNLGISKWQLLSCLLIIDVCIFFPIMIFVYVI